MTFSLAFPDRRIKRICEHALSRCDYPFTKPVKVTLNAQNAYGAVSHVGWIEINDRSDNFARLEGGARAFIHEAAHQVDLLELTEPQREDIQAILGTDTDWESFDKPWAQRPVEQFCEVFVAAYSDMARSTSKSNALRQLLTPDLEPHRSEGGAKYALRHSYTRDGQAVSEPISKPLTLNHLADLIYCDKEVRDKLKPKRGPPDTDGCSLSATMDTGSYRGGVTVGA